MVQRKKNDLDFSKNPTLPRRTSRCSRKESWRWLRWPRTVGWTRRVEVRSSRKIEPERKIVKRNSLLIVEHNLSDKYLFLMPNKYYTINWNLDLRTFSKIEPGVCLEVERLKRAGSRTVSKPRNVLVCWKNNLIRFFNQLITAIFSQNG